MTLTYLDTESPDTGSAHQTYKLLPGDSVTKLLLCTLIFVVAVIADRILTKRHKHRLDKESKTNKEKSYSLRCDKFSDPFENITSMEADLRPHLSECKKNPNHSQFIPVDSFSQDNLPARYRDPDLFSYCRTVSDLTVQVVTTGVSDRRPESMPGTDTPYPFSKHSKLFRRSCTGYINLVTTEYNKPCPCEECSAQQTLTTGWCMVYVSVPTHGIFDESEAASTTCDLWFDRGSTPELCRGAVTLSGMKILFRDVKREYTLMTHIAHDLDLAERLEKLCAEADELKHKISLRFLSQQNSQRLDYHHHVERLGGVSDPVENCLPVLEILQKYLDGCNDENPLAVIVSHPLAVIVSHPHGCSKQLSVGHIASRDEIENCVNVVQLKYSTPTCPGSSGALVVTLDRKKWCFSCVLHSGTDFILNESVLGWS